MPRRLPVVQTVPPCRYLMPGKEGLCELAYRIPGTSPEDYPHYVGPSGANHVGGCNFSRNPELQSLCSGYSRKER